MGRRAPAKKSVFTIVAPVKPGELPMKRLDEALTVIHDNPGNNQYLSLNRTAFPKLHFASFVVFGEEEGAPVLVFENCVDGSRDAHLQSLARCPGLDQVFGHCQEYPESADERSRLQFLQKSVRRPQLYHLGAPYRTAASISSDREVRQQLDRLITDDTAAVMARQVVRLPTGIRQYWGWEIAAPWLALLVALVTVYLELRIIDILRALDWRARPVAAAFWGADALIVLLTGVAGWRRFWGNAVPVLRKRVVPWAIVILPLGVASAALRVWPTSLEELWLRHWVGVLLVAGVLAAGFVVSALMAVRAQRSRRIAELRVAAPGAQAWPLWRRLQAINQEYPRERPSFLGRVWHFRWWLVPVIVISVPVVLLQPPRGAWLAGGLLAAFLVKATWLAALTGWPAHRTKARTTKGLAFVIFGTGIGAYLLANLFGFNTGPPLFALLSLIGLFLLWVFSVPSADQPDRLDPNNTPVKWALITPVTDQEDHGVQNHMSLDAIVPQRWRRAVLWTFLTTLNALFYRSVLPDLWGGRLFGLPTVHCAQWVMLEGGRFVFLSNYDHTWSSYLDDFGTHLGAGIQKIWGQCANNPGTGDLERFKSFVRIRMVRYRVWYRAYPDLTVRQIWNTELLRSELARDLSEEDIVRSLRRLGAAPKILPELLHAEQ